MHIDQRRLIINSTDHDTVRLEKCIYALLIGNEIARVGSSKAPLKRRLRSMERDITGALNGGRYADEASLWETKLTHAGTGLIYARQGTLVTTPIGTFNAY